MRVSLVTRVVAVVVAVAVVAIAATAFVVAGLAEKATIDEVQRLFEQQDEIASELELAALDAGSWDLATNAVAELANDAGVRIVVRSSNGRTLLDSEAELSPTERTRLSQNSVQILSPFDAFFANVDFSEDEADFFDLDAEFNRLLGECLEQAGVLDSIEVDDFGSAVIIATDPEMEELCINRVVVDFYSDPDFFEPFQDENIPSVLVEDALLFLGYAGTGELAGLDSDLGSGVIIVTLLVTATSALIVGWWARRTLRPIGTMTVATTQMGQGDLSVRVDEGVGGELGELATSFNKMADNLAAEDDRRRRLTSDVAHELRTPLANVAGYLEAADDGLVEIGPALFEILRDETAQLSHIVEDLQDLSLAESGRLHLIKADVRLSDVIGATMASFGSRAESAAVELRTTVSADDPIAVVGDAARLRQIATNLVENAIRHTEAGGQVILRAKRVGDMIDFSISDTGVGMSNVEVARVFERFYRADESRTRATGGSGLGLAIVHQLVTAMGGSIAVVSEVAVGSTFTVSLPVADS